jgi:hypothetical protein
MASRDASFSVSHDAHPTKINTLSKMNEISFRSRFFCPVACVVPRGFLVIKGIPVRALRAAWIYFFSSHAAASALCGLPDFWECSLAGYQLPGCISRHSSLKCHCRKRSNSGSTIGLMLYVRASAAAIFLWWCALLNYSGGPRFWSVPLTPHTHYCSLAARVPRASSPNLRRTRSICIFFRLIIIN